MKTKGVILLAISLLALAGCASAPETSDIRVQTGMSRDDLRRYFGEPLRIEHAASGEEDWYYHFVSWKAGPMGPRGSNEEFGEPRSYATVGIDLSRPVTERAIHLSAAGYVIEPVPNGKVVKD